MSRPPPPRSTLLLLAGLAFSFSGCDLPAEHLTPEAESGAGLHRAELGGTPPFQSTDEMLLDISRRVPGFGGAFVDREGVLNVWSVNPEAFTQAHAGVVAEQFRSASGAHSIAPTRILTASFAFEELYEWRLRLRRTVLGFEGVATLDISEDRNRVAIGISDAAAFDAVRSGVQALNIDPDAVIIEEVEPDRFATTLRDHVRPVHGGLQIRRTGGETARWDSTRT